MIYVHVDKTHIEQAWAAAPVAGPLTGSEAVTLQVLQPDRDRPGPTTGGDIFPALITRPASASIACKLRRLPDITLPRRPSADSTSSSSASVVTNLAAGIGVAPFRRGTPAANGRVLPPPLNSSADLTRRRRDPQPGMSAHGVNRGPALHRTRSSVSSLFRCARPSWLRWRPSRCRYARLVTGCPRSGGAWSGFSFWWRGHGRVGSWRCLFR
jgi:hypothetical protein